MLKGARKVVDYHPSKLILALVFAFIVRLRQINKIEILQYTGDAPHRFYSSPCKISQKTKTEYRKTFLTIITTKKNFYRLFTKIIERENYD